MFFSRYTAILLCAAVLLAGGQTFAQDAAQVKLGFVDVEKAIFTIDEGKARLKTLQDWATPVQEELATLSREISGLQAEMASKQGVANDAALGELNRRLVDKQRVFEDKQRRGKRDFDERQEAILKDLGGKLNDVITKYADENRFTAVFILKPNDLVYLAHTADITDTVIKLFNERYPYQQAK